MRGEANILLHFTISAHGLRTIFFCSLLRNGGLIPNIISIASTTKPTSIDIIFVLIALSSEE